MAGVRSPAGSVEAATVEAKTVEASRREFVEAMRGETEQLLRQVMGAVNRAPDGSWIDASGMRVRDLTGEYRRKVFEKALQTGAESAEGSFSPVGPGDGGAAEE